VVAVGQINRCAFNFPLNQALETQGRIMLYDRTVLKAVTGIKQRAERQNSLDIVSRTFVDSGILTEIDNGNHQVIFGRRGTGKTHLLRMLQTVVDSSKHCSCFVDCRVMGSTAQFTDDTLSIKHRSFSIFQDILSEIHDLLLNKIVELDTENSEKLLSDLDLFSAEYTIPQEAIKSVNFSNEVKSGDSKDENAGVGASLAGKIGFDLSRKRTTSDDNSETSSYSVELDKKSGFLSISKLLNGITSNLEGDLYIMIDEWSSIPLDIQPYLAEFIKRSLLPCSNVVVKIAALEFRSNFFNSAKSSSVGIELGADVSTSPSMDSLYSFSQDPQIIENNFSEMLYRHISAELPHEYLRKRFNISNGETMMDTIFEEEAFMTLTQASEGVIRDLINIFIIAFSRLQKLKTYQSRTKISKEVIYEATKQWFDRDKLQGLNDILQEKYFKIIKLAVTKNKSRYFLLHKSVKNTEILEQLIDLRVIHHVSSSFMSLYNDAEIYKVFNIDFGSYASLMEFDHKTKYEEVPFFDIDSFSKYPSQVESVEKYIMDTSYL